MDLVLTGSSWDNLRSCPSLRLQISRTSCRALHCCRNKPFQLDVSRLSSGTLALDHAERSCGAAAENLVRREFRFRCVVPKLQTPVPQLSLFHSFLGSRYCYHLSVGQASTASGSMLCPQDLSSKLQIEWHRSIRHDSRVSSWISLD